MDDDFDPQALTAVQTASLASKFIQAAKIRLAHAHEVLQAKEYVGIEKVLLEGQLGNFVFNGISTSHDLCKSELAELVQRSYEQTLNYIEHGTAPQGAETRDFLSKNMPPLEDVQLMIADVTRILENLFDEALHAKLDSNEGLNTNAAIQQIIATKLGGGNFVTGVNRQTLIGQEVLRSLQEIADTHGVETNDALKGLVSNHIANTLMQMPSLLPQAFLEGRHEIIEVQREMLKEKLALEIFGEDNPTAAEPFIAHIETLIQTRVRETLSGRTIPTPPLQSGPTDDGDFSTRPLTAEQSRNLARMWLDNRTNHYKMTSSTPSDDSARENQITFAIELVSYVYNSIVRHPDLLKEELPELLQSSCAQLLQAIQDNKIASSSSPTLAHIAENMPTSAQVTQTLQDAQTILDSLWDQASKQQSVADSEAAERRNQFHQINAMIQNKLGAGRPNVGMNKQEQITQEILVTLQQKANNLDAPEVSNHLKALVRHHVIHTMSQIAELVHQDFLDGYHEMIGAMRESLKQQLILEIFGAGNEADAERLIQRIEEITKNRARETLRENGK